MENDIIIITKIGCKPRPRATTFGGHTHLYTPKTALSYERYIASEYQRQGGTYFGGSKIGINIQFYFKAPQNTPKWKLFGIDNGHIAFCDKHKDLDNLVKSVLDGLNGVAYDDDKQVVSLHTGKRWTTGQERIQLTIYYFPEPDDDQLKKEYKETFNNEFNKRNGINNTNK